MGRSGQGGFLEVTCEPSLEGCTQVCQRNSEVRGGHRRNSRERRQNMQAFVGMMESCPFHKVH